jgi:hypothetical protein
MVITWNEVILDEQIMAASPGNQWSSVCGMSADQLEGYGQQVSLDVQLSWKK